MSDLDFKFNVGDTVDFTIQDKDEEFTFINGGVTPTAALPQEAKEALLECFKHVAWKDKSGIECFNRLEASLNAKVLQSIAAVYTQTGTVYDTDSLDSLKSDLVVTAYYDDGTSVAVTGYTLSGGLTEGISTVTVTYGEKTTAFAVTVTLETHEVLYQLPNVPITFTGTQSQCIDSGFTLFPEDRDLTMTISFTPTNSANNRTLFYAGETVSPYYSVTIRSGNQTPKGVWKWASKGETDESGGRQLTNIKLNEVNKIVVRHHAKITEDPTEQTFEIAYYNATTGKTEVVGHASGINQFVISETMRIGGARSTGSAFTAYAFVGTISDFVVYEGYFSDKKTNEYLEVE